jgi:hypothetical protein
MEDLQKEYDYYLEHRTELLEKFNGKVLVVKGQAVIGVFDSELEALQKTSQSHELGTFLIQKCDPTEESHTQTYHSRVAFT